MASKLNRPHPIAMLFVLMALAAGVCQPKSFAQRTSRSLTGTVTDQHHEPLKGAIVQVRNGATSGVASYITDKDGRYGFKRLDGDTDYRVWATVRGHRSKVKNLSLFDTNKTKVINFTITLR